MHLLAGTEVNEHELSPAVYKYVTWLDVEMPDTFSVHRVKGIEQLWKHLLHHHLFTLRLGCAFETLRKVFTFNEIHHVVARTIVIKEVVHLHDVWIMKSAQALRFFAKLALLLLEGTPILCQRNTHFLATGRTTAFILDKKFLDGHVLVKGCIYRHISITEPSRAQMAHNAIFAMRQKTTVGQQALNGLF